MGGFGFQDMFLIAEVIWYPVAATPADSDFFFNHDSGSIPDIPIATSKVSIYL